MRVVTMPVQLTGQEFREKSLTGSKIIEENRELPNDSFIKSNQYTGEDAIGRRLDLTSLINHPNSYLKGWLSDHNDADYYEFDMTPYRTMNMHEGYNQDIVVTIDNIPEGCDYDIILYDQNGNQVGIGVHNGNGGKSITIPNWNSNYKQYKVKVEAKEGSKVNPDEYYRLSFSAAPASKDNEAYLQVQEKRGYLSELRKKLHNGEDCSAEKEKLQSIDQKYEEIYQNNLLNLHKQQAEDVTGSNILYSADEVRALLDKLEQGGRLTEDERKLIQIYARAQEYDGAASYARLNQEIHKSIVKELEQAGVEIGEDAFTISVNVDGTVMIDGIGEEQTSAIVEKVIANSFSDELIDVYLAVNQEFQELSREEQEVLKSVTELERFLYKATDGKVALEDLTVTEKGEIKGLPANITNIINHPGNNVTYAGYQRSILEIKQYQKLQGDQSIPKYRAAFEMSQSGIKVIGLVYLFNSYI